MQNKRVIEIRIARKSPAYTVKTVFRETFLEGVHRRTGNGDCKLYH